MSTNSPDKELRINHPVKFDGDRTKTKLFLNSCKVYLMVNKHVYDDDLKKIVFVLSLMEGGTAEPIRGQWEDEATELDASGREKGFGTWANFTTKFLTTFQGDDGARRAIHKMQELKQTSTVDEYIVNFRTAAATSKITELAVLQDYFFKGLNQGIVTKILSHSAQPADMEGYYTMAINFDRQYQHIQRYRDKTTEHDGKKKTFFRKSGKQLRKLTNEERDKLRKEGRCFRCRETGHMANECPQNAGSSRTPPRRQVRTVEQEEDNKETNEERVRTLFEGLSAEEKEKFLGDATKDF